MSDNEVNYDNEYMSKSIEVENLNKYFLKNNLNSN